MANALSMNYSVKVRCITSPVELKNPFTGTAISTQGIWDTGATGSVITRSSAERLGLKPISRAIVKGVHGEKEVNVYYVKITLNNDRISLYTNVTECEELSPDKSNGLLVGMDIITLGDFCITNAYGKTTMSFIVPPQREIDFVKEINEQNKYEKMHETRIKHGDDKCPCGSGKLWKNCHGKVRFK